MNTAEKCIVLQGDPSIEVRLRRSSRTRRLSLRVSQLDGRVTLSLPARLDEGVARAFLEEKADWVRGHLNSQSEHYRADLGATIPVLGQPTEIRETPVKRPFVENETLFVSAAKPVPAQVAAYLKVLARERLALSCDHHAQLMNLQYGRLTLRDTRSRWGSCTSEGNLMFSWRLAMAPLDVLDYVAAHEVAHLAEMNHGPDFWRLVATTCADYKLHRKWLRDNGADLHRIRFRS